MKIKWRRGRNEILAAKAVKMPMTDVSGKGCVNNITVQSRLQDIIVVGRLIRIVPEQSVRTDKGSPRRFRRTRTGPT